MPDEVRIPRQAVAPDGADLCPPVRGLLEGLDLLGTSEESKAADGVQAVFKGPPQSVALIEAGATAASKWWATGLGAAIIPLWGAVAGWWPNQSEKVQLVVLGGAFLVTAALVLAIGYLIASDVQGRAAASVSVIQARAGTATAMLEAVRDVHTPPEPPAPEIIPLPSGLAARNLAETGDARKDWRAIAMERHSDGSIKYFLVKGSAHATVPAASVKFI